MLIFRPLISSVGALLSMNSKLALLEENVSFNSFQLGNGGNGVFVTKFSARLTSNSLLYLQVSEPSIKRATEAGGRKKTPNSLIDSAEKVLS